MADPTVTIIITHRTYDIQPPLFVAGSFSDPSWVAQEMDHVTEENGEHVFTKKLEVEPNSKIQYKFRVGHGDWWILNQGAPTVTDEAGNKNNLIEAPSPPIVKPQGLNKDLDDTTAVDLNDELEQPRPVPTVQVLKQAAWSERSETRTPDYARTAAEVADSAVLVDPATPEPEVSDEVAAQTGYRQMTSTPPLEAAETAAEVADTARALDVEEPHVQIGTASPAYKKPTDTTTNIKDGNLNSAGYSNDPEPVPLFAHECAGLWEDEVAEVADVADRTELLNTDSAGHEKADSNDSTLEDFSSTNNDIKPSVESACNADQTAVERVPPSPNFPSRKPSLTDVASELNGSDSSSPSRRGTQHLPLPRPRPRGSFGERSLSAIPPDSIAEGDEAEKDTAKKLETKQYEAQELEADEEAEAGNTHPIETSQDTTRSSVVSVPSPAVTASNNLASPISDEDEAVVMKNGKARTQNGEMDQSSYLRPGRAATSVPVQLVSPLEPSPSKSSPKADAENLAASMGSEQIVAVKRSPEAVVARTDEAQPGAGPQQASLSSQNGHNDTDVQSEAESRNATAATSSAVEDADSTTVKKRGGHQKGPIDGTGTPASVGATGGREAAENRNWFTAFFRLIFVDWVGGLVSWIRGDKRQTLIATGVALVAIGAVWQSTSNG